MSITDSTQEAGTTTIAQGLREVADWLEAHPEIAPRWAFVSVEATEREHLETLAAGLGDLATESVSGQTVEIRGKFAGGVDVFGTLPLSKLARVPVPAYRSILPPVNENDFDAATGEGRR